MSNNISINMNQTVFPQLQTNSSINNNEFAHLKVTGFEKEKKQSGVEVTISQEGRWKSENNSHEIKKAGVTSKRETWENNSAELKKDAGRAAGSKFNGLESMRTDEPDTYAKFQGVIDKVCEIRQKWDSFSADEATEEEIKKYESLCRESTAIVADWYERKCMATGKFQDPARGKNAIWDSLEAMYSTKEHETSFNFYGSDGSDKNSLWRFHSKFNVLISTEMLKSLDKLKDLNKLSEKDRDEVSSLLGKIDMAIHEMQEAERQYEGNLEWLQFGVKLWDNGNVTYHAYYKNCENEDGIMANSAQELLEMLMKKE